MLQPAAAEYCGQWLVWPEHVQVRLFDLPAGGGVTPSGLHMAHSKGLPAIFGEIVAVGETAAEAGFAVGVAVLFIRYAGVVIDVHYDGRTIMVFNMYDVLARVRKEALALPRNGLAAKPLVTSPALYGG